MYRTYLLIGWKHPVRGNSQVWTGGGVGVKMLGHHSGSLLHTTAARTG